MLKSLMVMTMMIKLSIAARRCSWLELLTQSLLLRLWRTLLLLRAVRGHTHALIERTPMDANGAPCFCLLALTHPPRTFPLVSFSCCCCSADPRTERKKDIDEGWKSLYILYYKTSLYRFSSKRKKTRYPFSILVSIFLNLKGSNQSIDI